MSEQAIGLSQRALPWTTALLRLCFGTQPVQGKHGLMMPELVALDYIRMLLLEQRLPVLVLCGSPAWHKLITTWLQDVLEVRMVLRESDQYEVIRNTATFQGAVVVNGPVSEALVLLLGLLNNHNWIDVGPPLDKKQRRIHMKARYIVTTSGPMPVVKGGAPLCWVRNLPAKEPGENLLAGLRSEKLGVLSILAGPLNTTAQSPMWFDPELLVDSEPVTEPTA